jgi:CO/xanthine dehydrogenase Mo-binding subunit
VVAESEEICDRALRLIGEGIEWEILPFILDPEEAARPDAPTDASELNSRDNVWQDIVVLNQGDIEKGFALPTMLSSSLKENMKTMSGLELSPDVWWLNER